MFKNKPNEDDYDLSDMIDEYEEDSELRKKIEAMKYQQAKAEENGQTEDLPMSEDVPVYEDQLHQSSFSNADTEKTHVMNREEDYHKTLVIMDHQNQRSYGESSGNEKESEADSVFLYDNHEVKAEEITEADIEEFLEENDQGNQRKQAKQSMDDNKMNKLITTVIVSAVSLCLLIGVFFGVKMLIGERNSGVEQDPPITTNPDPVEPKPEDPKNEEPKPEDPEKPSNDTRIAEIKGKINANNKQIEENNRMIEEAELIKEENTIDENEYVTKRTAQEELPRRIGNIENEIQEYETQCSTAVETEEENQNEFCQSFSLEEKNKELNDLKQQLEQVNQELSVLNDKKEKFNNANDIISDCNAEITRLNNENTLLNEELSSLQ